METHFLTSAEQDVLPPKIMAILEEHRGARNAVTGHKMAKALGYRNDRKVRVIIAQLIERGWPVAASVSKPYGFYLVETQAEAAGYEAVLQSRAKATFARLRDFRRAVTAKLGVPYQPMLLDLGDGQVEGDDE